MGSYVGSLGRHGTISGSLRKGMFGAMFGPWGHLGAQGGVESETLGFELSPGLSAASPAHPAYCM
eukprot:9489540-Pyramimonas_sp.AAC.1